MLQNNKPLAVFLRRLLLTLTVLAPFAWFFGPALCTPRSFVFRDAAHYYYPLFEWSARQWAAGQIPLWNPQENAGVPVLADATSSVFYPGKLLFVLPLDYATKYKWYVAGHVLLAAWGVYRLARRWYASRGAATLAAMSYAFSGSVLFQHCNVVFLVGAAWLPLAVLAADRMLVERRWKWVLAVAAVWALMVLGGDPQAAYHAALLAVLQALLARRRTVVEREARETDEAETEVDSSELLRADSFFRSRWWLLGCAALLAAVLAAVQILPSLRWSAHSQRAMFQSPRSVYEIPSYLMRPAEVRGSSSIAHGLFGRPENGVHDEHTYHFSLGPWRLAELVWPNFSGRMFPEHRRWTSAIPAEGRIWTPSIYLGLMPLLLALGCCRFFHGPAPVRWATWTALAGAVASFGWYGVGWLLQEIRCGLFAVPPEDIWIGQPVGGLYWCLVTLLPGYSMFRFPAKLFVVATLGLSLLAAWGLDSLQRTPARRLPWIAAALAIASMVGGWLTMRIGPLWAAWLSHVPGDALFGPLDIPGSLADLQAALLHTAAISAGFWSLLQNARDRFAWLIVPLILAGTVLDLAVAQSWLVPTAPQSEWQRPGFCARSILDHHADPGTVATVRVYRGSRHGWLPEIWSASSSDDRQLDGLRWDIDTMFPKYHLRSGLTLVESYSTLTSADYAATLRVAKRHGFQRPDDVLEPNHRVLDALGTRYLVLPGDIVYPHAERLAADGVEHAPADCSLWLNPRAFPRAWIVHDLQVLPPLVYRTHRELERRTREIWFPAGVARDLRKQAVVEVDEASEDSAAAIPDEISPGAGAQEFCRIAVAEPQRIDLDVQLAQPGLVVLSDLYYPGWTALLLDEEERSRERIPILRTNRILRGIQLPAGTHRVSFRYRPTEFYFGALLSSLAWLAAAAAACAAVSRRLRQRSCC